jgi:predicted SprT family Zn-dependent metalloprotease
VPTLSIAQRYNKRTAARAAATELLARHGLHRWKLEFNRRKRTLGLCVYTKRTIELSTHFVDRNSLESIQETILHEIAHALVGPGHGHDRVWKQKAIEIGAKPERCGEADMPPGRWRAKCSGCSSDFSRCRRPQRLRGWSCLRCGPTIGKLVWREVTA